MDAFLTSNQKLFGNNIIAVAYKNGKVVYKKELEKETGDFNGRIQVLQAGSWQSVARGSDGNGVMWMKERFPLDDKSSEYIPIFAKYMKTYITIRNCLTFTTGIHADPPGPAAATGKIPVSRSRNCEVDRLCFKKRI